DLAVGRVPGRLLDALGDLEARLGRPVLAARADVPGLHVEAVDRGRQQEVLLEDGELDRALRDPELLADPDRVGLEAVDPLDEAPGRLVGARDRDELVARLHDVDVAALEEQLLRELVEPRADRLPRLAVERREERLRERGALRGVVRALRALRLGERALRDL